MSCILSRSRAPSLADDEITIAIPLYVVLATSLVGIDDIRVAVAVVLIEVTVVVSSATLVDLDQLGSILLGWVSKHAGNSGEAQDERSDGNHCALKIMLDALKKNLERGELWKASMLANLYSVIAMHCAGGMDRSVDGSIKQVYNAVTSG